MILEDEKDKNMSKKTGIIVSGYFNPIHKGHIEYFNNAKTLADELFVIVNNDLQRFLKGSKEFQQEAERFFIVSNIKSVDHCILSIDSDRTVRTTIEKIAYANCNRIGKPWKEQISWNGHSRGLCYRSHI